MFLLLEDHYIASLFYLLSLLGIVKINVQTL